MIGIFDEDIRKLFDCIAKNDAKVYPYDSGKALPTNEQSELILMKDTAFELGGSDMPCTAATVLTDDMPVKNQTILIGKELKDVKKDCNYAKIVIISVNAESDDEQAKIGRAHV